MPYGRDKTDAIGSVAFLVGDPYAASKAVEILCNVGEPIKVCPIRAGQYQIETTRRALQYLPDSWRKPIESAMYVGAEATDIYSKG